MELKIKYPCYACMQMKFVAEFSAGSVKNLKAIQYRICKECKKLRYKIRCMKNPNIKRKRYRKISKLIPRSKDPISWSKRIIDNARHRAKEKGLAFNLKFQDIVDLLPENRICPVLGIEMILGYNGGFAASLDKIIPELGYVRGNVAIISNRANTIKTDANYHEILAVGRWLEKKITVNLTHGVTESNVCGTGSHTRGTI